MDRAGARRRRSGRSGAIRAEVAGTVQELELADVIAATLISRFNGRSINQLCAMGSITIDEFTQSVAYREIFGHGHWKVPADLATWLAAR